MRRLANSSPILEGIVGAAAAAGCEYRRGVSYAAYQTHIQAEIKAGKPGEREDKGSPARKGVILISYSDPVPVLPANTHTQARGVVVDFVRTLHSRLTAEWLCNMLKEL